MKVLASHIKIGDFVFTSIHEVRAKRSIFKIGSTASIKLPATAVLRNDSDTLTKVETAQQFKVGDKVEIKIGYGKDLKTEFVGFVKRINFTTPVEVECEDYIYHLKKKHINKSWQATTLLDVVTEIVKDIDGIELSASIPQINFKNFEIKSNAAEALEKIKTSYGLVAYFNTDGELYVGLAYTNQGKKVKYALNGSQTNVIKSNALKYRLEEDIKIKIKAIYMKPDNTKTEVEVGDSDGELRTLFFYDIESKSDLETIAKEEIQKYKFTGYQGKMTTFLQPFAEPTDTAFLIDPQYQEREGEYYIEGTEVKFGTSGGRRILNIGIKILDKDKK